MQICDGVDCAQKLIMPMFSLSRLLIYSPKFCIFFEENFPTRRIFWQPKFRARCLPASKPSPETSKVPARGALNDVILCCCGCVQEQLAVKALSLTSVFGEVERLREENRRLEKICCDRTREIDLIRHERVTNRASVMNTP